MNEEANFIICPIMVWNKDCISLKDKLPRVWWAFSDFLTLSYFKLFAFRVDEKEPRKNVRKGCLQTVLNDFVYDITEK